MHIMAGERESMRMIEELEQFSTRFREEVRIETQAKRKEMMPELTDALFDLFAQTGDRVEYEAYYFLRRRFLAAYGLEALIEQQEKGSVEEDILHKLAEIIEEICQEQCWALPAHTCRGNENWDICIDLFASETAQTLAVLCDEVKDLPEHTKKIIQKEVERRIFTPFFNSLCPYPTFEHARHNWNAVCGGSIGSAILHLLREDNARLEKGIRRICNALTFFAEGYSEDGVCMEGMGYYTYGMTYFVNFAEELFQYTNGKMDLLRGDWGPFKKGEEDKRCRMAAFQSKCFFADGKEVSFSDSCEKDSFQLGLSCALALRFPKAPVSSLKYAGGLHKDSCYRFAGLKMNLVYPKLYMKELKSRKAIGTEKNHSGEFEVFPFAQWAIGKAENGIGMACKGGSNGEPHNHNDVGSFLYEANGSQFLADLGAGEYTKEYFGENRYKIFCNRSLGHNVPIIDGKEQCAGEEFSCSDFRTERDLKKASVTMELAKAYPKGSIKRILRKISFQMESGILTVWDQFTTEKEQKIQENLVTRIPPLVQNNRVILKGEQCEAVLMVIEPKKAFITVKKIQQGNHDGKPEDVYIIQWSIEADGKERISRFQIQIQEELS